MSWLDLYQGDQHQALRVQPNEGHDLPSYWSLHGHDWLVFGEGLIGLAIVISLGLGYKRLPDFGLTMAAFLLRLARKAKQRAVAIWGEVDRRSRRCPEAHRHSKAGGCD